MATKVSALAGDTSVTGSELLYLVDGGVSKQAAISAIHTGLALATTAVRGAMSPSDKLKLTGISAGAQVNAVTSVHGRQGAILAQDGDVNGIDVNMQDKTLQRPKIRDYAVQSQSPVIVSNALGLDLATGNDFLITLNQNLNVITVSSWGPSGTLSKFTLALRQDGTGNRNVSFPATWRKPSGNPLSVSTTPNAHDEFAVWTRDGGTTVYIARVGQAFAA